MTGTCLLLLAAAAVPAQTPTRVTFNLRDGVDKQPGLRMHGPGAVEVAKAEPEGLRITLPATRTRLDPVGVEYVDRLDGDFEIVLGYEIVSVGEPPPQAGAGVQLTALFASPNDAWAGVTRTEKPKGSFYGANYVFKGPDGKQVWKGSNTAARAMNGQLKLTRAGGVVAFHAAEAGLGFQEIRSVEAGTYGVRAVRAVATSGRSATPTDVRLVSLAITATNRPPEPTAATAAAASASTPGLAAPPPSDRSRVWLGVAVVVILVLAGTLVVVLIRQSARRNRG